MVDENNPAALLTALADALRNPDTDGIVDADPYDINLVFEVCACALSEQDLNRRGQYDAAFLEKLRGLIASQDYRAPSPFTPQNTASTPYGRGGK